MLNQVETYFTIRRHIHTHRQGLIPWNHGLFLSEGEFLEKALWSSRSGGGTAILEAQVTELCRNCVGSLKRIGLIGVLKMAASETLTINFADGYVHRFTVTDGNGAIYAANIETGGYGVRKAPCDHMTWYGPADVTHVAVLDDIKCV